MNTKLVASVDKLIFESKLNAALDDLKDKKILEIQYKPIALGNVPYFTALIIYE